MQVTRDAHERLERRARWVCIVVSQAAVLSMLWFRWHGASVLALAGIVVAGLLPYLVIYNVLVRGWSARNVSRNVANPPPPQD